MEHLTPDVLKGLMKTVETTEDLQAIKLLENCITKAKEAINKKVIDNQKQATLKSLSEIAEAIADAKLSASANKLADLHKHIMKEHDVMSAQATEYNEGMQAIRTIVGKLEETHQSILQNNADTKRKLKSTAIELTKMTPKKQKTNSGAVLRDEHGRTIKHGVEAQK